MHAHEDHAHLRTAMPLTCAPLRSHLANRSDCENCRFAVPGAWGKLKAACGKYPIATYHASCACFFASPPVVAHTGVGQVNETPSLVNDTPSLVNDTPSLVNGTPSLVNDTPLSAELPGGCGAGGAAHERQLA